MKKTVYYPSLKEFVKIAEKDRCVPVYRNILVDTETPVSAFLRIDDGGSSFLFESAEGGEKWGRYSFLAISPRATFKSSGDEVEIVEDGSVRKMKGDPLDLLREFIAPYKSAQVEGLPRFYGGAVGYMGYEMARLFERLPDTSTKDIDIPDSFFMLADTVLIFDNLESKMKIVSNIYISKDDNTEELYKNAVAKIDSLVSRLKNRSIPSLRSRDLSGVEIVSNFSKRDFLDAVTKSKEYIRAGDIIQVVISKRSQTSLDVDPFSIYRALRFVNPSPYMFFLRLDGIELVGSSPEVLVRVEGRDIDVRPIAGTRPRGSEEEEDRRLENELINDCKERAEHIMLVDLGRNDVGRVSEIGSIEVNEFMIIERYSHVMHIVSNIHGILKEGKDPLDALRACFPAGTLTGAPKIRAMEIIEEIEPSKRGAYGGTVGYLAFSGNMDMCITIRTILIKDGKIYIQAGAGVVADSDPEAEYEETVNKAKGMLKAIEIAREGLE